MAYLHDDEEDERDEDVDLGVFPGVVVADVVELFRHALAAPRAIVEQRDQRLVLRQLTGNKHPLHLHFSFSHLTDAFNQSDLQKKQKQPRYSVTRTY